MWDSTTGLWMLVSATGKFKQKEMKNNVGILKVFWRNRPKEYPARSL